MSTISQPMPDSAFMRDAARALTDALNRIEGGWSVTNVETDATAIRLRMDPAAPALAGMGEEAFAVVRLGNSVTITGHTTLAVRHGAYWYLEKLGWRRLQKHDAWEVFPPRMPVLADFAEVHEPAFKWRLVWHPPAPGDGGHGQPGDYVTWNRANRMLGAWDFGVRHGGATPLTAVQARAVLAKLPAAGALFSDLLAPGVANVTPPDGTGHGNAATVIMRAAVVATHVPEGMIGVYSYSDYDLPVPGPLPQNLLVKVANHGTHSWPAKSDGPTFIERVEAFSKTGAQVGVYDYADVAQFSGDLPPANAGTLSAASAYYQRIRLWARLGVQYVTFEAGDGWGARGLMYYVISRLLWEPDRDPGGIIDDFCRTAFGPAAAPMRRYYARLHSGARATDRTLALAFRDLSDALRSAGSDAGVRTRIEHCIYYARYWWLRTLRDTGRLDLEGHKRLYALAVSLTSLYVLSPTTRERLRADLVKLGVPASDLAIIDGATVPPLPFEADTWLAEAQAALPADAVDAADVDARRVAYA